MTEALVERLRAAADEHGTVRERVREVGVDDLRRVRGAYNTLVDVLDRYEEEATGYGDFEKYVEFQERVVDVVEDLPDDLPEREAFEAADDAIHQRRLSTEDFENAREALAPARELAELHAEWERVREEYRAAYGEARERLGDLDDAIEDRWRVLALGQADLDAAIEDLREPIEAYDEAVREDFDDLLSDASARETFAVVESADSYPLLDVRQPPTRLTEYVREADAGEESVRTLLEYADYSAEKLGHYVDDPGEFKRSVGTSRTYLRELSADPLTVAWPPPPASKLRWWAKERLGVVKRFGREETVAALRDVRALASDREWYGRRREAAYARHHLDDEERAALEAGEVREELDELERERERLEAALAEVPEP